MAWDRPRRCPPSFRGRLFRKYFLLLVFVVSLALLTNSLIVDGWFAFTENKKALLRIQSGEQAEIAATKIGGFITEIANEMRWTTQLPWAASLIDKNASTPCVFCARCRRSPNCPSSMPPATSSCGCRGWRWMCCKAERTIPLSQNSPRRWRAMSTTVRSISAAVPNPIWRSPSPAPAAISASASPRLI